MLVVEHQIFIAGMLVITGIAFWLFRKPVENWTPIFGIIAKFEEIHVKDTLYHDHPPIEFCYPLVEYQFRYNGKAYRSHNVATHIRDIYERTSQSEHPWSNWKEGEQIKVFVNPKSPSESVLLTEMSNERMVRYRVMIIGAYASLVGFYVLIEISL